MVERNLAMFALAPFLWWRKMMRETHATCLSSRYFLGSSPAVGMKGCWIAQVCIFTVPRLLSGHRLWSCRCDAPLLPSITWWPRWYVLLSPLADARGMGFGGANALGFYAESNVYELHHHACWSVMV
ncbi:hypothetical protein LXA43DRAFT_1033716 [Ganoderma leucocontextum]|nr:hypothetical protein LXA43DRAFT_1033716 [Ganoderma leucocontextum]